MPHRWEAIQMSAFGRTLKAVREKAGLTQAALAEQAGLHVFCVAKLEQGLRAPTWASVRALAHALNISVEVFDVEECPENPPTPSVGKQSAGKPGAGSSGQKKPARGKQ